MINFISQNNGLRDGRTFRDQIRYKRYRHKEIIPIPSSFLETEQYLGILQKKSRITTRQVRKEASSHN